MGQVRPSVERRVRCAGDLLNMGSEITPEEINRFWFSEEISPHWFNSSPQLDQRIRSRFETTWRQAATGNLEDWGDTPRGCLALVILCDQLPLNMFRGCPEAFATEQQAIAATRQAVVRGFDRQLGERERAFLYMPLMHSERLADQELSVRLYREAGLEGNLAFAEHHCRLIRRFGRFPHRNAILGRPSTDEEVAYLASEGAFHG